MRVSARKDNQVVANKNYNTETAGGLTDRGDNRPNQNLQQISDINSSFLISQSTQRQGKDSPTTLPRQKKVDNEP